MLPHAGGAARDGWNSPTAAPTAQQTLRPATAGAPLSTADASSTDNLLLYPEPSPSESSVFSLPLYNPVSEPLASPSPPKHHPQPTLLPTAPTPAAAPAHPASWTHPSVKGGTAATPVPTAAPALANTVTAVAALTAGGPGLPSRADVLLLQPTAGQHQAYQRQAPPTQEQHTGVGGATGVVERGVREWQEEEFQRRRAEILGLAVEPQSARPLQPGRQVQASELTGTQPGPQLGAVQLQQQHAHPPRVLATDYHTSQHIATQRLQQHHQQQPLSGHQQPAQGVDSSYQSLPYELSITGATAAPSTRHPTQGGSTHPAADGARVSDGGGSNSSYAPAGDRWLGPSDSEVDRLRRVGDEMDRRLAQAAQRLAVGGSGPGTMVPSLASWAHRDAATGAKPLAAGSAAALPGPQRVSLSGRVGPEGSGGALGSGGERSAVSVGEAIEAASAAGWLGQGGVRHSARPLEPSGDDARGAPQDRPSRTSLVQQQEHQGQQGHGEEDPESTLLPALTAGIVGTLVQLRESMARSSAASSLFHSQLSPRQQQGSLPAAPSPAMGMSSARSSFESASGLGVMATPVGRSASVPTTPSGAATAAAVAFPPAAPASSGVGAVDGTHLREATLRDLLTAPAAAQGAASRALGVAAQLLPPPPPLQRSSSPAVGAAGLDLAGGGAAGQQQVDRQATGRGSAPGWPPPLPARPGAAALRRSYDSSTADVAGRPPVPSRSASARASSDSV